MKILHLVVDDKFIDSAVREFELVRPGVHEFLILDTQPPYRYVRSPSVRTVSRAAWAERVARADVAAVVLHCLSVEHQPLLREIPPGPKVIWIGWGYDYYGLVSDAFPEGLLLPKTTEVAAQLKGSTSSAEPGSMRSELSRARPYPEQVSADDQAALQRVDYFSPVLEDEHRLVRRHQPTLRAIPALELRDGRRRHEPARDGCRGRCERARAPRTEPSCRQQRDPVEQSPRTLRSHPRPCRSRGPPADRSAELWRRGIPCSGRAHRPPTVRRCLRPADRLSSQRTATSTY